MPFYGHVNGALKIKHPGLRAGAGDKAACHLARPPAKWPTCPLGLAGEPLQVRCRQLKSMPLTVCYGDGRQEAVSCRDGCFSLALQKGEEAALFPEGAAPAEEIVIEPVEAQSAFCGFWGGNKPWRLYGIPFSE